VGFGKSPVYTVYIGTEESKGRSINQSHRSLSGCLHAVVRALFIFLCSLHVVLPMLFGGGLRHNDQHSALVYVFVLLVPNRLVWRE
jgi:hypothetical protein